MKLRTSQLVFFVIAAISSGFLLIGCSGGGDGLSGDGSGAAGNGTVALFLADGPADDYESIHISVCSVSLIPADDDVDGSEVFIFESDPCYEVDLLKLREEEILLNINKDIPAGYYSKIRLEVDDVRATGGPCGNFKLPSGKIDLNPRGGIYVETGQTLALHLDMDADKSINLHQAGQSGKCIFRPMVFVSIETIAIPQACPLILEGEIERLVDNGFVLDLGRPRGFIDVQLSNGQTIIFGEQGTRVRRTALEAGQQVSVRGGLMPNGDLSASVVVIGEVLNLKGTVVSAVDTDSIFPLQLDPGQAFVGAQVDVEITAATLILTGCNSETGPDAIQTGRRSKVFGKYDVDQGVLRAVAVLLESQNITGSLIGIARPAGDVILTIIDDASNEYDVLLEPETPVYLRGDGEISLRLLNQLVKRCGAKPVSVELDPEAAEPTAAEVLVEPERTYGVVAEIHTDSLGYRVLLFEDGQLVRIQEGATILLNTKRGDKPVDFDAIRVGDRLTVFGLSDCVATGVTFYAFIVLIDDSAADCDDDCDDGGPADCEWTDTLPGWIRANNVKICLKKGRYDESLTIYGNKVTLIGECDKGGTVLTGDVTINGNKATFMDIAFEGDIYENGNNAVFENRCGSYAKK